MIFEEIYLTNHETKLNNETIIHYLFLHQSGFLDQNKQTVIKTVKASPTPSYQPYLRIFTLFVCNLTIDSSNHPLHPAE